MSLIIIIIIIIIIIFKVFIENDHNYAVRHYQLCRSILEGHGWLISTWLNLLLSWSLRSFIDLYNVCDNCGRCSATGSVAGGWWSSRSWRRGWTRRGGAWSVDRTQETSANRRATHHWPVCFRRLEQHASASCHSNRYLYSACFLPLQIVAWICCREITDSAFLCDMTMH